MQQTNKKWPKIFPPLSDKQKAISDDFMQHWHETLGRQDRARIYNMIDFGHNYVVKYAPKDFTHTLEIGAGLGDHLPFEKLNPFQKENYVALELRENMAEKIKTSYPDIHVHVGDCQEKLPFPDNHFNRIIAIHILEHLPNLPAAVKEMFRLCDKKCGIFSVIIPCESGLLYALGRKVSAERIFKKRYKQSYRWLISREHINLPQEIFDELDPYFEIQHRTFFPFFLPSIHTNLFIGLTLRPRAEQTA